MLTREEKARSEDRGDYFKVIADNRDLNYDKYFSMGEEKLSKIEDYNSHNTHQLNSDELCELLKKLPYIQMQLTGSSKDYDEQCYQANVN